MKKRVTKSDWNKVLKHWKKMSEEGYESLEKPISYQCAFYELPLGKT